MMILSRCEPTPVVILDVVQDEASNESTTPAVRPQRITRRGRIMALTAGASLYL